jgi:tRNA nucleotidyltransferase (CCA-adding enzyme)
MKAGEHLDNKGLTIITTHINADFDAIASMLAAQKLYPGSLVVFPGSQEKNLRNFFVESMVYLFNMADMKKIDFANVKRVVMVDTRQPGRIGSSSLERDDIDIHIRPSSARNDMSILKFTVSGSTVAILTEILRKKNEITADEQR